MDENKRLKVLIADLKAIIKQAESLLAKVEQQLKDNEKLSKKKQL